MGVMHWQLCVAFNCALVFPCLFAKTFSINEAIAAESRRKLVLGTPTPPKLKETGKDILSIIKALRPDGARRKLPKLSDSIFKGSISPLQYRKTFEIKSPLKPKKLKIAYKPRYKRKHLTSKEIKDAKFTQKYVPLLASLRMLFDNLLDADTSNSIEEVRGETQQRKYIARRNDIICRCSVKSNDGNETIETEYATNIFPTDITPKEQTASPATESLSSSTYIPTASDLSGIRKNKILPILLARNTSSSWRDHHGLGKRSGSTFYRSNKGNIARYHGADEHNTTIRRNETSKKIHDENPFGLARDNASDRFVTRERHKIQFKTRIRDIRKSAYNEANKTSEIKNTITGFRRNVNELKGATKHDIRRNETKGTESVREFTKRLREPISKHEISNNTEPLQSKEVDEKGDHSVTLNSTSSQRIVDRNSTSTEKTKNFYPTNETLISIQDLKNPELALQKQTKNNTSFGYVMIIDGYSITRDKDGKNKFSSKTIRVLS